jgi:hypothetical protein
MTHQLATLSSIFNTDDWPMLSSKPHVIDLDAVTEVPTIEDPLVLSCTLYRYANPNSEDHNPTVRFLNLIKDQSSILKKTTDVDRKLADEIRRHYRGKFVFLRLRGEQPTKFRQDLEKFVAVDWDPSFTITEKTVGLICKLPFFYEHDMGLINDVFGSETHNIKKHVSVGDPVTLTFIKVLDENQKGKTTFSYWFKDSHDNRFSIPVEKNNSLIPTWEEFIKKPVTLSGHYTSRSYDSLEFYKVARGWKIIG